MTMVELAAKAGMDQGHLSKLERGLLQYTQQNLESLAAALGVTPAALLESEPPK
jgi:transcriptional regulator with XRE-family HTH domain